MEEPDDFMKGSSSFCILTLPGSVATGVVVDMS